MYALGLIITLLSLPAFVVPFFTPFSYCWTVQTLALGIVTAVFYGVINDQMAMRQNKNYFILGHTSFHKRLLATENVTANAFIWGVHATWILGLAAGIVLMLAGTITQSCAINPLYLTPIALSGALLVNLYAHFKSKKFEEIYQHDAMKTLLNHEFRNMIPGEGGYDTIFLNNIPAQERASWLAVGERNGIGYTLMPLLGILLLMAIIAARILIFKNVI